MASLSLVPYNFTIPDQSPTFRYSPYGDGDLTGGWNVSYTESDDSSFVNALAGSIPQGTSFHRTNYVGASLNISWTGTACYLYGQAPSSSYTTKIDGNADITGSPIPDQNLLASYAGLQYGVHTLTLDVVQAQEVTIDAAVLTVGVAEEGHSVKNETINAMAVDGSTQLKDVNPAVQLSGTWFPLNTDPDGSIVYPFLVSEKPSSSATFTLSNTSAFLIYGDCYYDHDLYNVQVRDATNPNAPIVSQQLNGSSRWFSSDCLLYFQSDMDRNKEYQVTFQNVNNVTSLYHITTLDGSPPADSGNTTGTLEAPTSEAATRVPEGVIVGITIAIIAALAVLGGLVFMLVKMRRKRRTRQFVDLSGDEPTFDPNAFVVSPFVSHTSAPVSYTTERGQPYLRGDSSDSISYGSIQLSHSASQSSSGSGQSSSSSGTSVDAGPVSEALPPDYDPSWAKRKEMREMKRDRKGESFV